MRTAMMVFAAFLRSGSGESGKFIAKLDLDRCRKIRMMFNNYGMLHTIYILLVIY